MLTLNGWQEQTKCEKDKTWVTSVPNSSVVLCEVCKTKLSKYGQYRMDREQNNIVHECSQQLPTILTPYLINQVFLHDEGISGYLM